MKTLVAALAALAVGFGVAFAISSAQKEAALSEQKTKLEAQWRAERDQLEEELRGKRKTKTIEREVAVTIPARTAEEILQNLLTLKPVGAARVTVIRKIVHELEDLAQLKDSAVPPIRNFLARNEDMDYSERSSDEGSDRRWRPSWSRSAPPTEFTLPPSLRIGLFDVLEEIATPAAEETLAEVLSTSGRAVEVACVVRILEALQPGKYRDVAITAAKDLLCNPLAIDNPNRLDEQAESYLYAILEMYKDNSFTGDAAKQLVSADGKLNRNARDYLTKTQGEQAIPALLEAYKSPAISNEWDKASIAGRILDYVGDNQQANNLLNDIVTNTNIDGRMRSFAVMRLAGGMGGTESPTDKEVIKKRMMVVAAMKPGITDERVLRAVTLTENNLQNLLDGKPIENPFSRDRGGDRGGPPRR
jgi:hypothetical protein